MSELLTRFANLHGDDPRRPLVHLPGAGASWSADDVWRRHLEIADLLMRHGVAAHRLVLSATGNAADSVPLLLACRAIGAAVMPLDAGATRDEIRRLAERFGAAAIASQSADGTLRVDAAAATGHVYPNVAVLKLTSGSTGVPKAALASDAHLIADATHIIDAMGIGRDDTQIAAIPISHSYGLGNLMLPLLLQGTPFVLRESFVPQQLPADARRFGARIFPGVPFMFDFFVANPPADGWPPTLQLLISAGAPLAAATARTFHERYGVKIHSFYGATETGGIAYDDTEEVDDSGAVGRVLPGVTVTLRDADCGLRIGLRIEERDGLRDEVPNEAEHDEPNDQPNNDLRSAIGSPQSSFRNPHSAFRNGVGRIHVVSDAVVSGYSDAADEAFTGGGFLTGDCGAFDACQRLVLVGRVSSFVNVAGRKVQPDEVEQVLRAMPGVVDVRVVAAVDARRGQQLVACIVAAETDGLTPLAVRRFCASRLAPHKIPRSVVFLDAMPLTPRGKTDRAALDDLVRAQINANPVINSEPQ